MLKYYLLNLYDIDHNLILPNVLISVNYMYIVLINYFFIVRYGVVLKKLDLLREAVEVFVDAVNTEPLHWGAWLELVNLIKDKETVSSLPYILVISSKTRKQ